MKTIYIIRHAKSDQSFGTLSDIDRPLNIKGYTDAHKISAAIKPKMFAPDAIITSPAIRAITTAFIFARSFEFNAACISIIPRLYQPDEDNYLDIIAQTDNKINTLLLFAHNPHITNTVNSLTAEVIEHMPTSGVVGISNDCDNWETFAASTGKLILFDYPKKN